MLRTPKQEVSERSASDTTKSRLSYSTHLQSRRSACELTQLKFSRFSL